MEDVVIRESVRQVLTREIAALSKLAESADLPSARIEHIRDCDLEELGSELVTVLEPWRNPAVLKRLDARTLAGAYAAILDAAVELLELYLKVTRHEHS